MLKETIGKIGHAFEKVGTELVEDADIEISLIRAGIYRRVGALATSMGGAALKIAGRSTKLKAPE